MDIGRGKVIVVERGSSKVAAGQGVLKAMGVIWRHWRESFGKLERFDQTAGTFTIQYPEERRALPEAFRNMPILLYDDATGQELCTSCFQCQRICPPQVIHMTQARDPNSGKAVPAVAEFVIEYDACMSCGFCAEVCPFDAIKMDHDFELSTDHHFGLTIDKQGLNRPVSYYERIAPTMWAAARESANKKLQANIKRRPAGIGVAPHLGQNSGRRTQDSDVVVQPIGEQRTENREPRTGEPKAQRIEHSAADTAPAAGPLASTAMSPAEAKPQVLSAEDKAAKLAAIRAANAAKAAGSTTPAPAASEATVDDKAAKLVAIRAANVAKKAAEEAPSESAAEPPSVPAAKPADASSSTSAADSPAPADDKAAKLAAIRAANAAKKAAQQNDPEQHT